MAKRQWAVGLENDNGDEAILAAEVERPEEAVESHLIEVEGLDQQVSDLVSDGEELSEDTEQLEQYQEAVEQGAEAGGMDETAARVVDVAVESIAAKWGIRRPKIGVENFSGAMRAQSTKVAVESIGETIKAMWQKFVVWIGEIIGKVKDFWLKYNNAGKSMKARAEKLYQRLDKGLGQKDKTEIGGGWIKSLVVNGVPNPSFVIDAAAKAGQSVTELGRLIAITLDDAGKAASASGSVTAGGVDQMAKLPMGEKATKKISEILPAGAEKVEALAIPGGAYLVTFERKGIAQVTYKTVGENVGDKKIATPDEAVMQKAIKAIEQYGDALETSLKGFRAANDKLKALETSAKEASKKFDEAKSEGKGDARAALNAANAAVSSYTATQQAATAFLKNGGMGLIGYVTAGIGAYKKTA